MNLWIRTSDTSRLWVHLDFHWRSRIGYSDVRFPTWRWQRHWKTGGIGPLYVSWMAI